MNHNLPPLQNTFISNGVLEYEKPLLQRKPIRFIVISNSFNFQKGRFFAYSGIFRHLI